MRHHRIVAAGLANRRGLVPVRTSQRHETLRLAVALHNIKDRILAQSKPVADFPIRLTFVDKLEHFECETIRLDALTWGSMSTTPWRGGKD
jgi:hypothetical protein